MRNDRRRKWSSTLSQNRHNALTNGTENSKVLFIPPLCLIHSHISTSTIYTHVSLCTKAILMLNYYTYLCNAIYVVYKICSISHSLSSNNFHFVGIHGVRISHGQPKSPLWNILRYHDYIMRSQIHHCQIST